MAGLHLLCDVALSSGCEMVCSDGCGGVPEMDFVSMPAADVVALMDDLTGVFVSEDGTVRVVDHDRFVGLGRFDDSSVDWAPGLAGVCDLPDESEFDHLWSRLQTVDGSVHVPTFSSR